jgi:hypothetical protein
MSPEPRYLATRLHKLPDCTPREEMRSFGEVLQLSFGNNFRGMFEGSASCRRFCSEQAHPIWFCRGPCIDLIYVAPKAMFSYTSYVNDREMSK